MEIQAIYLLKNGSYLSLTNAGIQEGNRWKHFFSPSYHSQEVRKIIAFVERKVVNGNPDFLPLADALIQRYKSDRSVSKVVQAFDRQMAPFRPQLKYLYPQNQKAFEKWKKAGQPPEIFRDFPRFTDLLESSLLLSQMKVTRDAVRIIDGEPAILVEGQWVKEPDFCRRFAVVASKAYGQKFVIDKETRDVYTYLDNGRGLQKHHPYITEMNPVSTLNEEEYQRTWVKACAFIRPQERGLAPEERSLLNQNRPFILQLVTSLIREGNTNVHRLLRNAKHPYLRLIIGRDNPELGTKKAEVYELGYGWKKTPCLPLLVTTGRFRSPDAWEYKTVDEKIVTNIPLTHEEAHLFYQFSLKYHRDGVNLGNQPGFQLTQQNCSVFTREVCRAAGILVPTEIDFKDALERITPECFRKVGHQIREWRQAGSIWLHRAAGRFIPEKALAAFICAGSRIFQLIDKVRDIFIAFILTPFRALLGGFSGRGGPAFRQMHERPAVIEPPLHNWRNFFDLSSYKLNLPSIAQEWQLQQPSTVVYQKPIKLAIVPPLA